MSNRTKSACLPADSACSSSSKQLCAYMVGGGAHKTEKDGAINKCLCEFRYPLRVETTCSKGVCICGGWARARRLGRRKAASRAMPLNRPAKYSSEKRARFSLLPAAPVIAVGRLTTFYGRQNLLKDKFQKTRKNYKSANLSIKR